MRPLHLGHFMVEPLPQKYVNMLHGLQKTYGNYLYTLRANSDKIDTHKE